MKARIEYDGFSPEESDKLKPFLDIAGYFARRWGKEVILDAPHGSAMGFETGDSDSVIHIHFFSAPDVPNSPLELGYADHIFRFTVPKGSDMEVRSSGAHAEIKGNGVAARLKSRSLSCPRLEAPEGRAVAQVMENHVFILFDIAHEPWAGARPVLWEICEFATKHLPPDDDEAAYFPRAFNMHTTVRDELLTRKEELRDELHRLSRLPLEGFYAATLEERETARAAMKKLEIELLERGVQIAALEGLLKDFSFEEDLDPVQLGLEFERIHSLRYILGIKINNGKMEVYTAPVEHRDEKGKLSMLSQFMLAIEPTGQKAGESGNLVAGLSMGEYGWAGPFQHPESSVGGTRTSGKPVSPCFGGTMSTSVRKAFIDFDYPAVIALLLDYLDGDSRPAPSRPEGAQSSEPYVEEPFYANEADLERTKEKYVEFVTTSRAAFRKKNLEEQLASLTKQQNLALSDGYAERRRKFALCNTKARFLTRYLAALERSFAEKYEAFFEIPALMHCEAVPNGVWIVLGPGRGIGALKDIVFLETTRLLIKPAEGNIYAWGGGVSPSNDRIADGDITGKIVRGELTSAVELLYKAFRSTKGPAELAEPEVLSREIIEEMLQEHAFSPKIS